MIYEALTARVPVGLLSVLPWRNDRVVKGVRCLLGSRNAMAFEDWRNGQPLCRSEQVFDEANRVAAQLCRQWGRE